MSRSLLVSPSPLSSRDRNNADKEHPFPQRTAWTDRQIAAALFTGTLVIYIAVLRGRIEVYDTKAMLDVTQNLVNHGSLKTTGAAYPYATTWSPYGIGVSLLAVPAYVLSKLIGHFDVLSSLINPILTAMSVLIIYRIARALDWKPFEGLFAAISYGVLSLALWYTVELLSEPGVTLCVLVIVLGLVRWRQGNNAAPLWIGIAAGCAAQLRTDSIFTIWIALLAIPFFVPWSQVLSKRALGSLLGPMAVSLVGVGLYNDLRFHKIFVTAYGKDGGFDTPLPHGLYGLLLSSNKGLFVFSPLTLVGVAGLLLLIFGSSRLRDRALGAACLLIVVPRTIFFAKWNVWTGGAVWGPRFLLPVVAVLSLLIVPVLRATESRRLLDVSVRVIIGFLAVVSGIIAYLSVRVPFGEWASLPKLPVVRARLGMQVFPTVAQRAHAYLFNFKTAPVWGYITLLRLHLALVSGRWWLSGNGAVGYLLLFAGILCLLAAMLGTRRVPEPTARTDT